MQSLRLSAAIAGRYLSPSASVGRQNRPAAMPLRTVQIPISVAACQPDHLPYLPSDNVGIIRPDSCFVNPELRAE